MTLSVFIKTAKVWLNVIKILSLLKTITLIIFGIRLNKQHVRLHS